MRSLKKTLATKIILPIGLSLALLLSPLGKNIRRNIAHAWEVTLGWDANSEGDLLGYSVYYDPNDPGEDGPYTGTGANEGASGFSIPVALLPDPNNPTAIVSGLDPSKGYYFVVTAFDTQYNESDYSNQVHADHPEDNTPPFLKIISSSNTSGSFNTTLGWTRSTRENLEGYYVYYGPRPCPPLNGTDADQGASPISVAADPNSTSDPTITLTGLPSYCTHYIAVTNHDTSGDESDLSNIVYTVFSPGIYNPPEPETDESADVQDYQDTNTSTSQYTEPPETQESEEIGGLEDKVINTPIKHSDNHNPHVVENVRIQPQDITSDYQDATPDDSDSTATYIPEITNPQQDLEDLSSDLITVNADISPDNVLENPNTSYELTSDYSDYTDTTSDKGKGSKCFIESL